MNHYLNPLYSESLERLCKTDQMISTEASQGLQLLQAKFSGDVYENHRHDTYAIGITDSGVQCFDYRGAMQSSTPGSIIVLHPDELHNGRAGSSEGFGYRMLYVEPALIADAVRSITGRYCPLPFVKDSVCDNPYLSKALRLASHSFVDNSESLAIDQIILLLAQGLIDEDSSCIDPANKIRFDYRAVHAAREYLQEQDERVVHSKELEKLTGLCRYELSRQFSKLLGTSPYRYSVNRRLDKARKLIGQSSLANLALQCGFADQAHFSRLFKAAFGLTPSKYAKLNIK